jgi:transcription elongation GreA/GreB family factor
MTSLKEKVHAYYLQQVDDKIDAFRDMITALTADASNDAKGSAGDKHETALSMMHLEQEKLNAKLSEFLQQRAVLEKIDPQTTSPKIALGSLIKANNIYLYLSQALPKITIDDIAIIALSPQSPLGSKLMGMQAGDELEIGSTKYLIQDFT